MDQNSLDYLMDRIEKLVVPNTQRLIAYFREQGLRVIYIAVGCERPDYLDALSRRRQLHRLRNMHRGTREHEMLHQMRSSP